MDGRPGGSGRILPASARARFRISLSNVRLFFVLGLLVGLLVRSAKRYSAIIAAGVGVLISTLGVVATPFTILALTLAIRYVLQGICSVEFITCSESIFYAHAALWVASKYPRVELLLAAVALFLALGALAVWQCRQTTKRAA